MNSIVDTHAHIYHEDFLPDREEMVERFVANGVSHVFMPNVDVASIEPMLEMARRYPQRCFPMMGLHPCAVTRDFEKDLRDVERWLHDRRFIAVGEIGTDLFWDKTFFDQQCEAFRIQLDWSVKHRLPVVIHCRNSMDETISMIEERQNGSLRGVFHCFTGNVDQAKRIVDLGFYLGIGGVSTFKKGGLDRVLPEVDLSRMVLETDSPYLAPVPHRGKRNEPSYLPMIAQRVAEITRTPLEMVAEVTTRNAFSLFDAVSR